MDKEDYVKLMRKCERLEKDNNELREVISNKSHKLIQCLKEVKEINESVIREKDNKINRFMIMIKEYDEYVNETKESYESAIREKDNKILEFIMTVKEMKESYEDVIREKDNKILEFIKMMGEYDEFVKEMKESYEIIIEDIKLNHQEEIDKLKEEMGKKM